VTIRRSKTDQTGEGHEIAIPHGFRIRPVERLRAWLGAAGITEGPLFRAVLKGSRVQATAMRTNAFVRAMKARLAAIDIDPAGYSGRSLRSGLITSAAARRASVFKIQEVSRHKSIDVLSGYVRSNDLFDDHCAAGVVL